MKCENGKCYLILPCPFCGGEVEIIERGNSISYYVIQCKPCRAEVKGTKAEQAIEVWNRRVES